MRTEATPTSIAEMIMDLVSAKHKGVIPPSRLSLCPNCAQNMSGISKHIQSKDIECVFRLIWPLIPE